MDHEPTDDRDDGLDDDLDVGLDDDLDGDAGEVPAGEPTCPSCGSPMVRIVYGYPSPNLFERSARGEVVLGGCVVTGFDPTHQCTRGHQWAPTAGSLWLDPGALAHVLLTAPLQDNGVPRVVDGWVALGSAADDRADDPDDDDPEEDVYLGD